MGYAAVREPPLRASARAELLGLIDQLSLPRAPLRSERIEAARFQRDALIQGAIRAHVDLAFRSPPDPGELMVVATRGIIRVAWHPELEEFPVGVALALPARRLVESRAELFAEDASAQGAPFLIVFALATNPPRLGAGSLLLQALRGDSRRSSPPSGLLAFSPLTGLRAAVIGRVDDPRRWAEAVAEHPDLDAEALREQVLEALARDRAFDETPEPLATWLAGEARAFAASPGYTVGRFHQSQGGSLVRVCDRGDPRDSDAMWARALFDYGR